MVLDGPACGPPAGHGECALAGPRLRPATDHRRPLLDGSDSAEIIVAAGALLAVGIAAFSAVVLASGLVLGRWRAIALGALLLGAVAFALMQALPRDDLTPAIAAATAALSLGEPVTTVVLGVVLIAGVRSSRQTGPSSARRIVPVEVLS